MIPIPGVGTAVGSALGGAVSDALEMEFAGLNSEDQEFEKARRFVRIAGRAAQKVADAQPNADPLNFARKAVMTAVREHIPGLDKNDEINPNTGAGPHHNGRYSGGQSGRRKGGRSEGPNERNRGRWERRGRTIVLHGI
jgi:hypothetical protein